MFKMHFGYIQQSKNLPPKSVTNEFTSTRFEKIFNVFFPVEGETSQKHNVNLYTHSLFYIHVNSELIK